MAIIAGSVEKVEILLAAGVSLDGALKHSSMPLLVAISAGYDRMVELLVKRGADLEAMAPPEDINGLGPITFRHGSGALHAAMNAGISTVRLLLRLGADPNSKDAYGTTPLYAATALGENGLPYMREFLKHGADPTATNNQGMTPLHMAAGEDSSDAMRMLLAVAPSAINIQGKFGLTPLCCAVTAGKEGMVRFLAAAGANDFDALFAKNMSSLHHAVEARREDLVRVLLDVGLHAVGGLAAIPGAMRTAVNKDQPRILHMLVTVQGEGAQEHYATQLVQYRAQNPAEARREPILHMAARFGSSAAVGVLMRAGAHENQPDYHRRPATAVVGSDLRAGDKDRREAEAAYVGRMLARGPAWRARSWAWASSRPKARAGVGSVAGPMRKIPRGVRIFRPSSPKFFVRLFPR